MLHVPGGTVKKGWANNGNRFGTIRSDLFPSHSQVFYRGSISMNISDYSKGLIARPSLILVFLLAVGFSY